MQVHRAVLASDVARAHRREERLHVLPVRRIRLRSGPAAPLPHRMENGVVPDPVRSRHPFRLTADRSDQAVQQGAVLPEERPQLCQRLREITQAVGEGEAVHRVEVRLREVLRIFLRHLRQAGIGRQHTGVDIEDMVPVHRNKARAASPPVPRDPPGDHAFRASEVHTAILHAQLIPTATPAFQRIGHRPRPPCKADLRHLVGEARRPVFRHAIQTGEA